jgi:hypothetical protein
MTDESVVTRFAEIVRYGDTYGPYNHRFNDGSVRRP